MNDFPASIRIFWIFWKFFSNFCKLNEMLQIPDMFLKQDSISHSKIFPVIGWTVYYIPTKKLNTLRKINKFIQHEEEIIC